MPERAIQEMKNHLNSWREKFVHALFRHTCTLIACLNSVIGKNDFTLTKTVTICNSYYIVCSWTRKFWHASSGVAARSVNRISAFMNKQYSNCFSQREIILADHFCKTSCFFSSPFRHAIKVQVCRNSAWTNFSLHELRWFFISCIARSGIPVD